MYRIIAAMSILIRGYYLPNPFEQFAFNVWSEIPVLKPFEPYFMQVLFEPLLGLFAYTMAGLFYDGQIKSYGSFLYLVFYIICNAIVYFMCVNTFGIIHIIAALFGCLILVFLLKVKLDEVLF